VRASAAPVCGARDLDWCRLGGATAGPACASDGRVRRRAGGRQRIGRPRIDCWPCSKSGPPAAGAQRPARRAIRFCRHCRPLAAWASPQGGPGPEFRRFAALKAHRVGRTNPLCARWNLADRWPFVCGFVVQTLPALAVLKINGAQARRLLGRLSATAPAGRQPRFGSRLACWRAAPSCASGRVRSSGGLSLAPAGTGPPWPQAALAVHTPVHRASCGGRTPARARLGSVSGGLLKAPGRAGSPGEPAAFASLPGHRRCFGQPCCVVIWPLSAPC